MSDEGIDVSHWQGRIDWPKVKEAGIRWAIVKATEGETYIDPRCRLNIEAARAVGLMVGLYHFARPDTHETGKLEARHFATLVRELRPDFAPMLDLEVASPQCRKDQTAWALGFLEEVERKSGHVPGIYVSASWPADHGITERDFVRYPLWVAHWGVDKPRVPAPWSKEPGGRWSFWQYTSKGRIPGVQGDVDRCKRQIP